MIAFDPSSDSLASGFDPLLQAAAESGGELQDFAGGNQAKHVVHAIQQRNTVVAGLHVSLDALAQFG